MYGECVDICGRIMYRYLWKCGVVKLLVNRCDPQKGSAPWPAIQTPTVTCPPSKAFGQLEAAYVYRVFAYPLCRVSLLALQAVVCPTRAITASVDVTNDLPKEAVMFTCTSYLSHFMRVTLIDSGSNDDRLRLFRSGYKDCTVDPPKCPTWDKRTRTRLFGPFQWFGSAQWLSPCAGDRLVWPTTKSGLIIVISPMKLRFDTLCALSTT